MGSEKSGNSVVRPSPIDRVRMLALRPRETKETAEMVRGESSRRIFPLAGRVPEWQTGSWFPEARGPFRRMTRGTARPHNASARPAAGHRRDDAEAPSARVDQEKLPVGQGGRRGLQIDVWADDDKLGRLEVSKATVRWYPKGVSANPITRSWSQFRDWMESES